MWENFVANLRLTRRFLGWGFSCLRRDIFDVRKRRLLFFSGKNKRNVVVENFEKKRKTLLSDDHHCEIIMKNHHNDHHTTERKKHTENKFGKNRWSWFDDDIIWPFGGHPLMVIFRWFLEKKTKTFTFFFF